MLISPGMKTPLAKAAFWTIILLVLLCLRLPFMAQYFSIDNVNLALSLEKFNPAMHQPQPPGYPLFVLLARLLDIFFHNAERTFTAISILATAVSLWLAFHLGSRMFSQWAGIAGMLLLMVNPVMWHAGIEGPLRPQLALFSLLTAYCCWRCWNGEERFAFWGAVALGIGGGFRPDLIAFLFPLWLVSCWMGTRSWRTVFSAAAVLAVIVAAWTSAIIIAVGGFHIFQSLMFSYAGGWSQYSAAAPGSSVMEWLRQKNRLFVWNALGVIPWIWAVPVSLLNRNRPSVYRSHVYFFAIWIVPGVLLQAVTHFANPGHTLFSVSALCLIGGYVISTALTREVILGCAVVLNLLLFFDKFPLPPAKTVPGGKPSIVNAMLVGAYESSLGWIQEMDEVTRDCLSEINALTPVGRPSTIITTDSFENEWFMNWRIGRYYLPNRDLWVLDSSPAKKRFGHIRRTKTLDYRESPPLKIPVFREGRILFLIEPNSRISRDLAASGSLRGSRYVSYVDITRDSPSFAVEGFEIVPSGDAGK